ncbi:MAG: hypothetical protein GY810_06440 [Aureispira sp.]|nr:hypothetical protein [Aureispira sp.]
MPKLRTDSIFYTLSIFFSLLFFCSPVFGQEGWSGLWRYSPEKQTHSKNLSWSQLLSKNTELEAKGYRLFDVESHLIESGRVYHALWNKDDSPTRLLTEVRGYDNLIQKIQTLQSQYTLIDVESYLNNGTRYYIGVWQKSTESHEIHIFKNWANLSNKCLKLKRQGLYISDLETFDNGASNIQYLALFRNSVPPTQAFMFSSYDDLKTKRSDLTENGWRPADFERLRIKGKKHFFLVFEKGSGRWSMWAKVSYEKISDKRTEFSAKNVQLVDLEVHQRSNLIKGVRVVNDTKIQKTPDLCQSDKGFPELDRVNDLCGPTAVSNAFVWLSKNGYSKLSPYGYSKSDQIDLTMKLASAEYMRTAENKGTTVAAMIGGIEKYVENKGYSYETIDMYGWSCLGSKHSSKKISKKPDIEALKDAIADKNSIVILNFGWYYYDNSTYKYTRNNGHWVTAVGYGKDEYNNTYIIIHNPSGRGGVDKNQEYVKLTKMGHKEVTESRCGMTNTYGYYKAGGSFGFKAKVDLSILDAVLILKMD